MDNVSDKTQKAQEQILNGEKTLNQVREDFGLEPIDDENYNKKFVKLDAKE
jgi:hypothetical protein